jgi:hypothetical protein
MMQTPSLDGLADRLVFVHLDITCWSGKKSLTPEDLGLDRAHLPPESLISLGDKQLIDPAALRTFTSLRGAAHRHCLAVGTRFLGGYAVPAARAQRLLDRLADLQRQYAAARAAFLASYDGRLAAWADRQPPQWQPLIRNALVPAEYVGGRLRFAVQAVRFGAPDPAVVTHGGLTAALAGLSGQVFAEVAQLAREALAQSFQGKTAVTRRALGPVQAIRTKLAGLSFVDRRFQAVVGAIDRVLATVPRRQPIGGGVLAGLRQFLCLAAQPDGLRAFAATAAPAGLPAGGFDATSPAAAEAAPVAPAWAAFPGDAGAEADADAEVEAEADADAEVEAEGELDAEPEADAELAASPAGGEAEVAPSGADAGWFF